MTNIYDQHDKAFNRVSAYVIARDGKRVATIAFKLPADGAGRLYVYVHWLGEPMVRGFAGGYGYDKRSAACSAAAKRLARDNPTEMARRLSRADGYEEELATWRTFRDALTPDDGSTWDRRLEAAGFNVWQAV